MSLISYYNSNWRRYNNNKENTFDGCGVFSARCLECFQKLRQNIWNSGSSIINNESEDKQSIKQVNEISQDEELKLEDKLENRKDGNVIQMQTANESVNNGLKDNEVKIGDADEEVRSQAWNTIMQFRRSTRVLTGQPKQLSVTSSPVAATDSKEGYRNRVE